MAYDLAALKEKVKKMRSDNPLMPMYAVVVNVLRSEIMSYNLLPEQRLKELETAAMLGVSRSTVRRALNALTLEGLLIRRQNSGVEVAPMLRQEYRKIVEVRSMLDSEAAMLAATRRTDSDLEEMKRQIELLPRSRNIEEKTSADVNFHRTVYKASGNPYILRIYRELDMEMIRSRYLSAEGVSEMTDRICNEHMAIYQAIREQNVDLAYSEARKHIHILLDPQILHSRFMMRYG